MARCPAEVLVAVCGKFCDCQFCPAVISISPRSRDNRSFAHWECIMDEDIDSGKRHGWWDKYRSISGGPGQGPTLGLSVIIPLK